VIIVFWELTEDKSFLNYSLDELIFLNNIYDKYRSEHGLEIFTVYTPENAGTVSDNEMSRVKNLLKINKIKLPVLIDMGLKSFRDYGVIALPSTIMIGQSGRIKFIYPSFPIAARTVFDDKIRELLGLSSIHPKKKQIRKGDVAQSVSLYQYALQMFKKGLLDQALSPLKKSIQLDHGSAGAHNLMGIILRQKGDFEGAVSEFRISISLDDSNVHPLFNYALLLLESEKYSAAEEILHKTLALENNLAKAHYALGILYKSINRNEDAIRELQQAFELFEQSKSEQVYEIHDPTVFNRISTLYILSELQRKQGNPKQSLELLDKAAEIALGLDLRKDAGHMHRSKELLIYE
jgi:Flp pilus assembly protein TadD